MKTVLKISIVILSCASLNVFAEHCLSKTFDTFKSAEIQGNELRCNYKCHLFGCDDPTFTFTGKYQPTSTNWIVEDNHLICRSDAIENCAYERVEKIS